MSERRVGRFGGIVIGVVTSSWIWAAIVISLMHCQTEGGDANDSRGRRSPDVTQAGTARAVVPADTTVIQDGPYFPYYGWEWTK